jgi:hypothetical protein
MFRITRDPSSGSINSYLIKTTRNGSTVLVVCAVGVWRHIQDCAHKPLRTHACTTGRYAAIALTESISHIDEHKKKPYL